MLKALLRRAGMTCNKLKIQIAPLVLTMAYGQVCPKLDLGLLAEGRAVTESPFGAVVKVFQTKNPIVKWLSSFLFLVFYPRPYHHPNQLKAISKVLVHMRIFIFFNVSIRLISRKVVLFWLGYESGKRVFLVNATVFINGMTLKELDYSI